MKIQTARSLSQVFFSVLFLWFCLVSVVGTEWFRIRGWPVNWFLQLDPLVAMTTFIATGHFYRGLVWSLAVVVPTLFLGRFFCGWVCPFGAIQQALGYLAARLRPPVDRPRYNRPHWAQRIKYMLLAGLVGAALGDVVVKLVLLQGSRLLVPILLGLVLALPLLKKFIAARQSSRLIGAGTMVVFVVVWAGLRRFAPDTAWLQSSVQIGWLDPLCLLERSVNLVLLPVFDPAGWFRAGGAQVTAGAWLLGGVFLAAWLLSLRQPRFYCRFLCPLGALLGVLSRFTVWRIGKSQHDCSQCRLCESHCEGACNPEGEMQVAECVLCMNCFHVCPQDLIGYRSLPSAAGERFTPDLSRRGTLLGLSCGALAVPISRLGGNLGRGWRPELIRPPGALAEPQFLERCIKCGQCLRICPTNVLQPALFQGGLEGFWTPLIMPRVGRSGCQINCVACGHICPTAAIRPLDPAERHGTGAFAEVGPVRIGTAFIDRGRCLPWAMGRPCIVCQENCPVSPKAIGTQEVFEPLAGGAITITAVQGAELQVNVIGPQLLGLGAGDLFLQWRADGDERRARIIRIDERQRTMELEPSQFEPPRVEQAAVVQVHLLRPVIDPGRCIGCGMCEHECPVSGRPAIRVSAENESRHPRHRFWGG